MDLAPLHDLVGRLDRAELDRDAFLDGFVRFVAATIGCTRAGVWVFREPGDGTRPLHCIAMHDARRDAPDPYPYTMGNEAAAYFERLLADGCVVATDARSDPATRGFVDDYLVPLDIHALLDVGFTVNGRLHGIFSCEQAGGPRQWTATELTLLRRIAATASLALMRAATGTVDTAPGALWDPPTPWSAPRRS